MTIAVLVLGTNEVILKGRSLEDIRYHISVNPAHIIVYRTIDGWKPIEESRRAKQGRNVDVTNSEGDLTR